MRRDAVARLPLGLVHDLPRVNARIRRVVLEQRRKHVDQVLTLRAVFPPLMRGRVVVGAAARVLLLLLLLFILISGAGAILSRRACIRFSMASLSGDRGETMSFFPAFGDKPVFIGSSP